MPIDEGFTPRQFPIDPFDAETHSRRPWPLDTSSLPGDVFLVKQKNVVVVLGDPPLDAIAPLLYSSNLAASLIIIATTRAYSIPPTVTPAIRILRLDVPLASSDSNSSRLASILQWADRVATRWRASPEPEFEELPEEGVMTGYQSPPQRRSSIFGSSGSSSALPSPASSELSLSRKFTPPRSNTPEPQPRPPTHRAFDALFNFLPPDARDRHLLKHAILVTTLVRPFLSGRSQVNTPPPPQRSVSHRFSIRGRPDPKSLPTPAVVTTAAHIAHVIPPARAGLIHPLESFVLSYCFPARGIVDTPRPYVIPPAALAEALHTNTRSWSLAELILCGALDGETAPASFSSHAENHRAWLEGWKDIALTDLGQSADPSSRQKEISLPHSERNPPSTLKIPELLLTGSKQSPQTGVRSIEEGRGPRKSADGDNSPTDTERRSRPHRNQNFENGSANPEQGLRPPQNKAQPRLRVAVPSDPQPGGSEEDKLGVLPPTRRLSKSFSKFVVPNGKSKGNSRSTSMVVRASLTPQNLSGNAPQSHRTLSAPSSPARSRSSLQPHTREEVRARTMPSLSARGAEKYLATSAWPTPPPSSAATSPSSSPELRGGSNEDGRDREIVENEKNGEVPPWEESGTPPKRKRRGILAWIKR